MSLQPRTHRFRRTVGEQINHPMRFQIDQDGAIADPFSLRPIIHPKHLGGRITWRRSPTNERDEVCRTSAHTEAVAESCTGFTTERQGEQVEHSVKPLSLAGIGDHHLWQAFGKDVLIARCRPAKELPHVQPH